MSKPTKQLTIIQFESEDYYRSVVDLILTSAGQQIAAVARNLAETRQLAADIEAGKLKPDVAIIDTIIENHHGEGAQIAKKLKELVPGIKLIAYTIMKDDGAIADPENPQRNPSNDWADYVAIKSNRVPGQTIIRGLDELFGLNLGQGQVDPV